MTPTSRGSVRLASADPTAAPLIRLPQLDANGDYERLAEGLLRARDVAEQPVLREICDRPPTDLSTSDLLRQWIRQERYSIPHTVGTCAMGARPETGSVVDADGKVHGIDRLAVIDASIIPVPPSGFPHIVAIMLAERLASRLAHEADI
jgi:choline dehydrogenase-like flavoprotein